MHTCNHKKCRSLSQSWSGQDSPMRCIFWHCINPPTKVILPTPPISHWMWMILPCHCNIPKNGNNCADYCNYLGQSPHATYSGSPVTGPPTTNWAVQLVYN